jgi:hypothetical protein
MSVLVEHLAALLIEIASRRPDSKMTFFASDVPDLFLTNYNLKISFALAEETCVMLQRIGGTTKLESPLTSDVYRLDASGALYYFSDDNAPSGESQFDWQMAVDEVRQKFPIIHTYGNSNQEWVDRVVAALALRDLLAPASPLEIEEEAAAFAPASDRIVRIDHNAPEIVELREELGELEELVRSDNSDRIRDPEDKRRFVEHLGAAKRLLMLDKVSTKALKGLLVTVLAYLALKFADGAIGELASQLLALLGRQFGIVP